MIYVAHITHTFLYLLFPLGKPMRPWTKHQLKLITVCIHNAKLASLQITVINLVDATTIFRFGLLLIFSRCHFQKQALELCSVKKGVPESVAKFTGKYVCWSLFFNKVASLCTTENIRKPKIGIEACNFIYKETPNQVFSSEFSYIFKNTVFIEHFRAAASGL